MTLADLAIERLRSRYLHGEFEVEDFERRVARVLAYLPLQQEVPPPPVPPRSCDLTFGGILLGLAGTFLISFVIPLVFVAFLSLVFAVLT